MTEILLQTCQTKLKITTMHSGYPVTHLIAGDGREDALVRLGSKLSVMISSILTLVYIQPTVKNKNHPSWQKITETAMLTQWAHHQMTRTLMKQKFTLQHTKGAVLTLRPHGWGVSKPGQMCWIMQTATAVTFKRNFHLSVFSSNKKWQ